MAYDNLKTRVAAVIKENGNMEITGDLLQGVLLDIISVLGAGYQFVGVANPSTNPGMPDAKVFYLAFEPGAYPNFGGAVLASGIGVFSFDSAWHYASIDIPSRSDIETAFDGKMSAVTANAEIALKADSVTPVVPPMVTGSARGILGRSAAARFLYRQTSSGSGAAWLRSIHGRTVSYNQLVVNGDFSGGTTGWTSSLGTLTVVNGVCKLVITGTPAHNYDYTVRTGRQIPFVANHWYYVATFVRTTKTGTFRFDAGEFSAQVAISQTANFTKCAGIGKSTTSTARYINLYPLEVTDGYVAGDYFELTDYVICFDLTQAGLDSIITTPEQFEAWQMEQFGHKGYLDYTPGKLVSVNPTGVLTTGRNIWDEEWEAGRINTTTGIDYDNGDSVIRSKNHIPVSAGQRMFLRGPSSVAYLWIYFYDTNKQFIIGSTTGNVGYKNNADINTIITVPNGACFLRFTTATGGRTYNHDICINISDPAFDGQYESYNGHTLPLDFSEHFPNGLNGVNDVVDEVYSDEFGKFTEGDVKFGIVDLGTLGWAGFDATRHRCYAVIPGIKRVSGSTSIIAMMASALENISTYAFDADITKDKTIAKNDGANDIVWARVISANSANEYKTALSGVLLIYELATPQHVTFTDPSDAVYPVTEGGTEKVLPVNGSDPATIAPDMTLQMPRVLGKDTPAMGSLDNLVAAVAQKSGKTITKVWDPKTRSYQFDLQ